MKNILPSISVLLALMFGISNSGVAQSLPYAANDQYYAIEMNDIVCGYSHEITTPIVKGDKKLLQIDIDLILLQTVLGGNADMEIKSRKIVDVSDGSYTFIDSEINQGGVSFGSRIELIGDSLYFKNKATGEEKMIPLEEDLLLDNGSYYSFVLRDISTDWLDKEYKTIEPNTGGFDQRNLKFLAREEISLNGKNYQAIKLKEMFKTSGVSAELWIDDKTGYVLKRKFSNGRHLYLTDGSITKKIKVAKLDDVIFARVNKVITDIYNIEYMKVRAKIRSAGEWLSTDNLNVAGQSFEGIVDENLIDGVFEISHARYDGSGAPAFPANYSNREDLKEYLEPGQFIESDDQDIKIMAEKLTAGSENSWDAAVKISDWVARNISYAIPGGISAKKTLEIGNGECSAHSRLVAALCRNAGIPARLVIGCMYSNNYGGTFGQHAWNEVYMGDKGWIPIDATAMEPDYVDSGHIRLGEKTSFQPVEMEIIDYKIAEGTGLDELVPDEYSKYVGNYIGPNSGDTFKVFYGDGALHIDIPGSLKVDLKDPDENGMWYTTITDRLYFSFEDDGTDLSPYLHLYQLSPAPKTAEADSVDSSVPEDFRPYLGKYYFAAIADNITVIYQDSSLAVKDPTYSGIIRLHPPDNEGIWMDQFDQNGLKFEKNSEGKVTGITVIGEFVLERER